jgi:hydrogenase-1 operon protein HyaF
MKPFPIPVIAIGPGSQTGDEPLNYIESPGEMAVFRPPVPRVQASPAAIEGARQLLALLLARMDQPGARRTGVEMSLLELDPEVVVEVNELLGQGEVSVMVTGAAPIHIQESAFPGVWRIQGFREDGRLARNDIEAAAMPRCVREALDQVRDRMSPAPQPDATVMNAPAILNELRGASAAWRDGDEAHIINLTLLPMTPEDLEYLGAHLGVGPVTILSRGYGNCRITSTGLRHTWWVQYFNSTNQLILNTIEVVDVPVVALAADEDLADSVDRLREWLGTLE